MHRILIVDDEPEIVEGLYTLFQRQETMELEIYKAYSGFEALDRLYNTQIELILLDIQMPAMTGLQLMETVKANWPKCWIIFLTGYNEFDYIYEAVQYDRINYILKNEKYHKIIQTVESALRDIEESNNYAFMIQRAREQMTTVKPILRREFLFGLLQGEHYDMASLADRFGEMGIPLDSAKPFIMLLGGINRLSDAVNSLERTKLIYMIENICGDYYGSKVNTAFVPCGNNQIVWLVQPGDFFIGQDNVDPWLAGSNYLKESVEELQMVLMESLGISMSFVGDTSPAPWDTIETEYGIVQSFLYAQNTLGSDILYFDRRGILEESGQRPYPGRPSNTRAAVFKPAVIPMLETYLENGQKREFQALLYKIIGEMDQNTSKHYNPALEAFYSVALVFLSYINRWGLAERLAFQIGLNKLTRIDEHDSWGDVYDYFYKLSNILFDTRLSDEQNNSARTIVRAQQYIEENIDRDLSLNKLADITYLSPTYLSKLFKRQTGKNLLVYVNEARLVKAKELLSNHSIKIQDIGAAVGFNSPSYFSQFFKKAMGMSPQDFREKITIN